MITKVDLHFRYSPADEHRRMGAVAIEHDGTRLEPHQDITYRIAGREVFAHVTAIRARPEHLPHVYAEEVDALEMAD
jgi:hypothetical protein